MGGGDQVVSLKQFVQFGLDKQMAVGGALFELESIRALPDAARRMVDHGMVVGPAGRTACHGIQCRDQENYRCRGHGAQLVRLCVNTDTRAGRQSGKNTRRTKAGARAFWIQAAAGGRCNRRRRSIAPETTN